MVKPGTKTNTKAPKGSKEPTDDQKKSGAVTQTGAGDKPAPDTNATQASADPAKTGAESKPASVANLDVPKGQADPAKVSDAITSGLRDGPLVSTKQLTPSDVFAKDLKLPLQMTPEQSAELGRQIKGAPEELQNGPGPDGLDVTVVGPAKGFRRAGRRFGPEAQTFGADEITAKQLVALQDTPELVVSFSEKPAPVSED